MKRYFLLLLILIFIIKIGIGQRLFYYTQIGEVGIERISNDKILVKFTDNLTISQKNEILKIDKALKQLNSIYDNTNRGHTIKLNEYRTIHEITFLLSELRKNPDIIYANPYLVTESGSLIAYTNVVLFQILSYSDLKEIYLLAKKFHAKSITECQFIPDIYKLELSKESNPNTLEVANYLYETGLFEFSQPDFIRIIKPHGRSGIF